jgi:hypothetical protein
MQSRIAADFRQFETGLPGVDEFPVFGATISTAGFLG